SSHTIFKADEIDKFRFLAGNIPLTNIFLIDRELNYLMAEGPNFKYWGMDRTYFEGKNLQDVHTTNLEEIRPLVLRAIEERRTVSKELFYMKRVYELTAKPIMHNAEVCYVLGIVRDEIGRASCMVMV